MGFLLVFAGNDGPWENEQRERVRRLLYVDLRPLFEQGERMINGELMLDALLPIEMKFADGKFYYTGRYGKGEESAIAEPPEHAKSALEGIEDRFSR